MDHNTPIKELESELTQLREQTTEIRHIFELSSDLLGTSGLDGYFKTLNPAWERLLGYTIAELKEQPLIDFVHPDDVDRTIAETKRILREDNTSYSFYNRYRCKDGSYRWLSWRTVFLPDKEQFYFVTRDVTRQKKLEEALHLTQLTMDQTDSSVFWIREDGSFAYVNQSACDKLGYNRDILLGLTVFDIDPIFSRESWDDHWQSLQSGDTKRIETVHQTKAGEQYPVSVHVSYLDYNSQAYHCAIAHDVTDRKETEAALQSSENRFRLFFERSADAMLLLDGEQFVDCNPATLAMLRAEKKEDVLMVHPSILSPEYQPDGMTSAEKANMMIQLAFDNSAHRFEWMHKRLDGEEFPVEVTLVVIPMGEQAMLFTVWRDLTEQKQMESEQQRLQQEIIQSQQRLIQELSTPIIPVMEGVIIMPLVGNIDSMRAKDLLRNLLKGIGDYQAKTVIMDMTGVSIIDTNIVAALDRTIQAARLKGASTIVTGLSDIVAETIIDLGINWSQVDTVRDLQTGLWVAMQQMEN